MGVYQRAPQLPSVSGHLSNSYRHAAAGCSSSPGDAPAVRSGLTGRSFLGGGKSVGGHAILLSQPGERPMAALGTPTALGEPSLLPAFALLRAQ